MTKRSLLLILLLGLVCSCGDGKKAVETAAEDPKEEEKAVHLTLKKQEAAGFKTAKVEKGHLIRALPVTGRVTQDTDRIAYIFPKNTGNLQSSFHKIGDPVRKSEPLFRVAGVVVPSPRSGTLLSVHHTVGDRVDPLTSLGAVGETDSLRVVFDIFPRDVGFIALGEKAAVFPLGNTEERFEGEIEYISPQMDRSTQTLKAGALVKNRDQTLKFGMYVSGAIYRKTEKESLLAPESALQTVEGTKIVFVKRSAEEFEAVEIVLGESGEGFIEILSGLQEGAEVVSEGAFTLKSELLKESLEED